MKSLLLLTFIACTPFFLFSQKNDHLRQSPEELIEALKKKTNLKKPSLQDYENIKKIREIFGRLNVDSTLYYANIELMLVKKTKNPNKIASTQLLASTLLWKLQQPDDALQIIQENLKNKESIADTIYAQSLFLTAQIEAQKKLFSESLTHMIEASKIYEQRKDSVNSANCFSFLGGMQTFVLNEPAKGIPYFEKSLRFNNNRDEYSTIRTLINYSSALDLVSRTDDAIETLIQAERISKQPNNTVFLGSVEAQFAAVYYNSKKYEKSLEYAQKANSSIIEYNNLDRRTQQKTDWYIALNNKELGNYTTALHYFEELKKVKVFDPWEVRQHLIDIYEKTGDFEKAFHLQKEITVAKDSVNKVARIEKITEITERYENEKKEQEIATLNTEKELKDNKIRTQELTLYGIIGFFIILAVIGIFWYRTRMTLKETSLNLKTTRLQQRFLRTQLNPHFLFHALTSIESYMYKNDTIRSADFLRSFSTLMRNILEFSEFDFIPLRHDIDFIEKYMKLQRLSHESKFDYEIFVSSELKTEEIDIPPMLIQPAVENAILHGALNTEDGKVWIDFSKVEDQLQIEIRDNGNRSSSNLNSTNKLNKSMSLDITQTRIKNLHDVHGIQIDYTPFDSEENGDSSVKFILPL